MRIDHSKMQLKIYYEQVIKRRKWKSEECVKDLENKYVNITMQNEILRIMFRSQTGVVEEAYRLQIHRFGPTTYHKSRNFHV